MPDPGPRTPDPGLRTGSDTATDTATVTDTATATDTATLAARAPVPPGIAAATERIGRGAVRPAARATRETE